MCTRAEVIYKLHYVCVPCRRSNKALPKDREQLCVRCRRPMACAGYDFAAPRKNDASGWAAVAAVIGAGLRYDGFEPCGCGREPAYRPRTSAQVRARLRAARRNGLPPATALALQDPSDA